MVLRYLLRYLANNEQLIERVSLRHSTEIIQQRLAQSYPIRRAAQLTVYLFNKGKHKGQEAMDDVLKSDSSKIKKFASTFKDEIQKNWKEASKQLKDGDKK